MPAWFLLSEPEPLPAAENMARDEHLFNLCHEKKCGFFRFYAWENPTFSIGVSQKAARALNLDFIRANGCEYVRRVTGGKAVLHHREITYAVASSEDLFFQRARPAPVLHADLPGIACRRSAPWAWMRFSPSGSAAELSRSHNPCFSFPTPHEIEVQGKEDRGLGAKAGQAGIAAARLHSSGHGL